MADPAPTPSLRSRLTALKPAASKRRKVEARTLAIDGSATAVRALLCERAAGRITITRACELPIGADGERPDVRAAMGVVGVPCIVALSREESLLGRIELPTDDEAELRSMARMALMRDYMVEGVETLADFQRSSMQAGASTVAAASASRARVDHASASAGAPVARASVRALGMLALIRTNDALRTGSTLAVDATRDGLECLLARDGELMHSRGAALGTSTPEQRIASILVEFRRLLAALRASNGGFAIDRIVIASDQATASELSTQLASIAGCAVSRLDSHPRIGFSSNDIREQACASCLPLAGLLLEDDAASDGSGSAVDLLHPTPLIDVAARTRQRVLMVAGAMTIAALGGWTFGAQAWRGLEERKEATHAKALNAYPVISRSRRDELRIKHVEAYRALTPAWLAYFDALRRFAPDPSSVVLDGLNAQLDDAEISYADGKMTSKPVLRFIVDGEAKDRATADSLRDALVKDKSYTLASTGADARGGRRLPYPFAYTIRTSDLTPKQAVAAEDDKSVAPAKQGGGS